MTSTVRQTLDRGRQKRKRKENGTDGISGGDAAAVLLLLRVNCSVTKRIYLMCVCVTKAKQDPLDRV